MEIIIYGDFNNDHAPSSRMTSMLEAMHMVNITSPPGGLRTPPTYKRGKWAIDHIWVSGKLSTLTTGFGYLPFGLGFLSDHRGSFVDLTISQTREEATVSRLRRKLNSKNVKLVDLYLVEMNQLVRDHGLEEKLKTLEQCKEWGERQAEILQHIDSMWTTFSLSAEESLQTPKSDDAFSEVLHKLKLEKHYCRRILIATKGNDHFTMGERYEGHEPGNILLSRGYITQQIRKLRIQTKETKQRDCTHRETMLEEIVERSKAQYKLGGWLVKANVKSLRNEGGIKEEVRTAEDLQTSGSFNINHPSPGGPKRH